MVENKEVEIKGNRFFKVITGPLIEPITVDEVKDFARIDGTDEDSILQEFITAVRINAEKYLHRALIEQSIRLVMDEWNAGEIELPKSPLISITKVETVDEDDIATEYDSANYYAETVSTPGRLVIRKNSTWPTNTERDVAGFRIEYKAGYGALATDVPSGIRLGLMMWATIVYETRVIGEAPPLETMKQLQRFRVMRI